MGDMDLPTHMIYNAAGMPSIDGMETGQCRLCGQPGVGQSFDRWVKETFTDWDKLHPGAIICHACLFCTLEMDMWLAQRLGKEKPQRMRNYSHFVLDGMWYPLSKGDKAEMRRLLFAGADVAVIAESGQKHILPWARVGWWTFELAAVRPSPDRLAQILAVIEPLYQAGISKAEIDTGRYDGRRILLVGLETWRAAEAQIKTWRGALALALALFLAQKDDDNGTSGSSGSAPVAAVAGDRPVVQEQIPGFDLGAV